MKEKNEWYRENAMILNDTAIIVMNDEGMMERMNNSESRRERGMKLINISL